MNMRRIIKCLNPFASIPILERATDVPQELWGVIASFLELKSLYCLVLSSRYIFDALNSSDAHLWAPRCFTDFNVRQRTEETWKLTYKLSSMWFLRIPENNPFSVMFETSAKSKWCIRMIPIGKYGCGKTSLIVCCLLALISLSLLLSDLQ